MTAELRTWRLVLEYDGAAYTGWQRQPKGHSIQSVVEDRLSRVLGGESPRVIASGRTDAGVHALGQVCSFRAARVRHPQQLRDGLNATLPADIAVVEAAEVNAAFHAQRSAIGKLYRYVILPGPCRSALRRGRYWPVRWPLDHDKMRQALGSLVGRHDFTSFRASGCSAATSVRTIHRAALLQVEDELHVELYGEGFLRHMVRNIVGSLVDVGRGKQRPGWFAELLQIRDRVQAGRTAPGEGLFLVRVDYPAALLVPGAPDLDVSAAEDPDADE